jgi:hypothetical protein
MSWPSGAWAHLQVKRPVEHDVELYLFHDELNIGRGATVAAGGFRIDLQQVCP